MSPRGLRKITTSHARYHTIGQCVVFLYAGIRYPRYPPCLMLSQPVAISCLRRFLLLLFTNSSNLFFEVVHHSKAVRSIDQTNAKRGFPTQHREIIKYYTQSKCIRLCPGATTIVYIRGAAVRWMPPTFMAPHNRSTL